MSTPTRDQRRVPTPQGTYQGSESDEGSIAATMATQTTTQRKATAQKAAATRRRNAAKRSRSARRAAETRAEAQRNSLQSLAYKGQELGQRAVDVTVGAAAQTGDRVSEATRSVTTSQGRDRLTRDVRASLRDVQRRGTRARKNAQRTTKSRRRDAERRITRARREGTRRMKRARRDTERRARTFRRDAEQRVKSLRA
jgi:hypothetical protein